MPNGRRLGLGLLAVVLVSVLPAAEEASRAAFTNPFGIHLRPSPSALSAVGAPVIMRSAPTNEMSLVRRRDGTLEWYGIAKPASDAVNVMRSRDGGLTWSEPATAFALPGTAYYAVQVLEAADGALHAVVHILGAGSGGYRGRLYEVYHAIRPTESTAWREPRRIVPGYVGSIRGFTQLRGGRLLLAVARAVPERETAPATWPDRGWNDTYVYFSDDGGTTWQTSPDVLSLVLAGKNATRYGAIEPVLLERLDRVWMLVRDRGGRLWESFSPDGSRWEPLVRTAFISSDSPAGLLRLRDGRVVLFTNACQNWTDPRSYAMGGREVLHAAISADDGVTWRGFREVLHETVATTRGDRGTAYPTAVENDAGQVVLASGQGEGKRALVIFAPRWLEETQVRDELGAGPVGWTQYGASGLRVEAVDGGAKAVAIPLQSAAACGALWNFPMADTGEIRLRLLAPPEAGDVRLCLNDHFNRIDDLKVAEHAVFAIDWAKVVPPVAGRWQDVTLRWSDAQGDGAVEIEVDGKPAGRIPAQRPAQFGVNYLRVEFRATSDQGSVLLAELSARRLR